MMSINTVQCPHLSKYFPHGTGPTIGHITAMLCQDLTERVDLIYEAVQKISAQPSDVFLQSAQNSLRKSVGQISLNAAPLFENDGQCGGASEWFIALFLNLKRKHPEISTPQLLAQIAKEFSDGVGIQGAFLQKFRGTGEHDIVVSALKLSIEKLPKIELKNKDAQMEILTKISELKEGVYLLSFSGSPAGVGWGKYDAIPGHATVIIIEDGNYYFYEPNVGLLGTGQEIGTRNKTNDAVLFLMLCNQYSPYGRADTLFNKGLESLSHWLTPKEIKIIQELVVEFRGEGKGYFSAMHVFAILEGFKKRGRSFSEVEENEMLEALSIAPGLLQLRLEESEALGLNMFTLLE